MREDAMAVELDDSAMLLELKIWMDGARAALPGHPKIRHADEQLWKINNIAEQLKAEVSEKLSVLEARYDPDLQKKMALGGVAGSFSKANTRQEIYAREDGLWRQRMVLTRDVLTVVERQEIKRIGPVGQQRPALERFKTHQSNVSDSLMERLRARALEREAQAENAPQPGIERER
jgi:hypothetical protein